MDFVEREYPSKRVMEFKEKITKNDFISIIDDEYNFIGGILKVKMRYGNCFSLMTVSFFEIDKVSNLDYFVEHITDNLIILLMKEIRKTLKGGNK